MGLVYLLVKSVLWPVVHHRTQLLGFITFSGSSVGFTELHKEEGHSSTLHVSAAYTVPGLWQVFHCTGAYPSAYPLKHNYCILQPFTVVLDTVLCISIHIIYHNQDINVSFVKATTVDSKATQIHHHLKRTDGKVTFRCLNISKEP